MTRSQRGRAWTASVRTHGFLPPRAWAPPDHSLRKISDSRRLAADQGFSIHMNVRCSKEVVLASSLRNNLHSSKRVGRAQDHDRSWLAKSAGHEIRFRVSTRQLPRNESAAHCIQISPAWDLHIDFADGGSGYPARLTVYIPFERTLTFRAVAAHQPVADRQALPPIRARSQVHSGKSQAGNASRHSRDCSLTCRAR